MDFQAIRDGRNAARLLSQLSASECLIECDFDRLLRKILAGFEAALEDAPPPQSVRFRDFDETLARLRALGVRPSPKLAGRIGGLEHDGPNRMRTVRGLGVIDGDRP